MKKNLIIVLLLMIMVEFVNAQKQIKFTHIGMTDKPMRTIEIYPSHTHMDSLSVEEWMTNQYYVKESLFDSLYYYIKHNKIKPLSKSEVEYYFGRYSLSYLYETESYNIRVSWEEAILFFEGMLPIVKDIAFHDGNNIKDNCYLYSDIEEIISRIKGCHGYKKEKK